jgi:CYTH domain-containing protein/predicted ATPase
MDPQPTAYRIVLTGGPCGGKTTALAQIAERLQSTGFRTYVTSEAATILIKGGGSPVGMSLEQLINFQAHVLKLSIAQEDAFLDLAHAGGQRAVVICDRGTMDSAGYLPPPVWQALLDEQGWTVTRLRDRRYDAVIHLVTAALGAEEFYTTTNNTARYESVEEARAVDLRLRDAWLGHPHLRVIDNSTTFADKVRRVVAAVCRVVGLPEPVEVERKFLLRSVADGPWPVRSEEVEIEQTYLLTSDGSEARARRRGQQGSYTYTHCIKRPHSEGQRIQIEKQITGREYLTLLSQADPSRCTIRKHRRCFLWKQHYFELDTYLEPCPGLRVLEAEVEDLARPLALPPFVEIEREVTGEEAYLNLSLARREHGAG